MYYSSQKKKDLTNHNKTITIESEPLAKSKRQILVPNENKLPDFHITNHFVLDNAHKNTVIGKFFIKNDTSTTYKFELTDDKYRVFRINHQRQLILSKSRLNSNKNPVHTIKVKVTDVQNNTREKAFDILVKNPKKMQSQEIIMPKIEDKIFNAPPFVIEAKSSAQQPITYLVEGPARLNKHNEIQLTGVGTVRVTATALGGDEYAPVSTTQTFQSKKASQTLQIEDFGTIEIDTPPISIQAHASSNLPVTYQVRGVAQMINNQLVMSKKEGEVVLSVIQEGSALYEPVKTEIRFEVHKRAQKIDFKPIQNKNLGDYVLLEAHADSKLPTQFEVLAGNVKLVANKISLLGTGWVKIKAYQQGNDVYMPASAVIREFNVRSIISIVSSSIRPKIRRGEWLEIHFLVSKNFPSENNFQLVLSNVKGNFDSDTQVLGTISNTERMFHVQIPDTTPVGTNYRLRVVSTAPLAHSVPTKAEMVIAFSHQQSSGYEKSDYQPHRRTLRQYSIQENPLNITPTKRYGRYTVELDKKNINKLKISILNLIGNKIFEASYHQIVGYRERLDLSQAPVGDYKVHVMADEEVYTKRFRIE